MDGTVSPPAELVEHACEALDAWEWPAVVELRFEPTGLVNRTFMVRGGECAMAVLQRLNTEIFRPEVNEDIEAVTSRLAECGVATPRLIRARDGRLWTTDGGGGVWRCLTLVGDRTTRTLAGTNEACSAGRLVARFHAALRDLEWEFRSVRRAAQDTAVHVAALQRALVEHRSHRLYDPVARLGGGLMRFWRQWSGPEDLPERVVHGDLKVSNVRFAGAEAHALIDLDTVARGTIDAEMGDALRSWCNRAGEDAAEAQLDLEVLAAAVAGYASAEPGLTRHEWHAIVPGMERITLTLAVRFAVDALEERYFGWSPRYGQRGEHNLLRARGQASLLRAIVQHRRAAEAAVARV